MTNTLLKKRKYTFISDAGHGWISVSKDDLKLLGIENEISGFSYQKNNRVYLEEDLDAGIFIKSFEKQIGCKPIIVNSKQKQTDYSYIRSYANYEVDISSMEEIK